MASVTHTQVPWSYSQRGRHARTDYSADNALAFRGSVAWKPAASQGEGGCGTLWPSEVSCLLGQAAVVQGDGGRLASPCGTEEQRDAITSHSRESRAFFSSFPFPPAADALRFCLLFLVH